MKKLIVMLALGVLAAASQSALYFYDGFDYTAGTGLRGSATTIWSNSVTGSGGMATNRAGSLSYAGIPASTGGKVELYGYRPASAGSVGRITWTNHTDTKDLFASFILNVDTLGTVRSNLNIFSLRLGKGQIMITNNAANPGKYNIGLLEVAGKTTWAWDDNGGAGYNPGTSYYIVMSYTNVTSATNAFAQFWVNPVLGLNPDAALGTIKVANDAATWNRVLVSTGNGTPTEGERSTIYIDELRVGSTWGDVVIPEPATVGMLGLGALVTLIIRRFSTR